MTPGTKLGPYEILAPIGKGGMGEVWKAHDTKLGRDVALKILPAAFGSDPDRMARFEREARVLASLDHPNIAAIYGLEESNDVRALVLALINGPTLAERIAAGPIPLDEAIQIARQIAEAVEYAHDRGVIHRDLKPANIKITSGGMVKVLDFGLAKALDDEPLAGSGTNSPTLTMNATRAGVLLGTAAYMSPEQAKGKQADRRSDIWSFGAVLYEMLTGKPPFCGETVGDILASVIKEEPKVDAVPVELRSLITRCLNKNPRQRLQAIGEARITLENPDRNEPGLGAAPSTSRYEWVAWRAAVLLLLAVTALSFVHFREKPLETRVLNTTLLPPDGVEFDFGTTFAVPALSPDGTRIVFGGKAKDGKTQLYVRRLDSPTAQPLLSTEGAAFPFWSPDSRWVGYGQANKLKKIDIQGGPPVTVADAQGAFRGGSWNQEGVIVFGTNAGSSIMRVAAAGGTAAPASALERRLDAGNVGNPVYPWFLPDGRHFLYTTRQSGDIPVRVGSLGEPGKPSKVVAQAHSNAVYAQGHLLYLRENTLMAQPFDPDRLETRGEAAPLTEDVPTYVSPSRGAAFTVSAGGLLVYQSGGTRAGFRLVWRDREGKVLGNLGEPTDNIFDIAFSPDRKRLAAVIQSGSFDIWIYDTARGIPTRFTFNSGGARDPVWSPDGDTLYYSSGLGLFRKASNGASSEELLLNDSVRKWPTSVSPDGKSLLYVKLGQDTKEDLWVLPLAPNQPGGKPEPRVFLGMPFNEQEGQFSPDGNWVAYRSDESGQYEVYAAPFPGPGGKRQISSGGGRYLLWRPDGKELFYLTPTGQLVAAEIVARNGTLEIGRVQKLFDGIYPNPGTYAISADGQRFVVVENTGTATPRPLTVLQNWPAALRK